MRIDAFDADRSEDMTNGQLSTALAELEAALSAFRSAYAEWLESGEDGDKERDLRLLLDAAEKRLDEARQALTTLRDRR